MRRLSTATIAIASTGTVTLECAWFGVPTVAFYKTSALTYAIGRQIVSVKYLAMPNILAGKALFPELIQHEATPRNIAGAALELLDNPSAPQRNPGGAARSHFRPGRARGDGAGGGGDFGVEF